MPLIPAQTMVSVSNTDLLTSFDVSINDGSITKSEIVDNLSPSSLKILLQIVINHFPHKEIIDEIDNPELLVDIVRTDFNLKELLSESDIEDIQNAREVDIDEFLSDLDDDTLLTHIEEHRSVKDFITSLVESL